MRKLFPFFLSQNRIKQSRIHQRNYSTLKISFSRVMTTPISRQHRHSEDPSADDPYPSHYPIEENFILRLDPQLAIKVQQQIQEFGYPKDLNFAFSNPRHAIIRFQQEPPRAAILVDLPCIIESQKTIDRKQFYKVADISQMLIVVQNDQQRESIIKMDYKWPHGISRPLMDVRQRRFRPKPKGLSGDDIENAVQRLLQADESSLEVNYSVEQEDPEAMDGEEDISDLVADIEGNLMVEDHNIGGDEEDDIEQSQSEPSLFDEQMPTKLIEQAEIYEGAIGEGEGEGNSSQSQLLLPEGSQSDDMLITKELDELESEFQLDEYETPSRKIENDIFELQAKLDEKLEQFQLAPPNPLIKQRLESSIKQLQWEIEEKTKLLHNL